MQFILSVMSQEQKVNLTPEQWLQRYKEKANEDALDLKVVYVEFPFMQDSRQFLFPEENLINLII